MQDQTLTIGLARVDPRKWFVYSGMPDEVLKHVVSKADLKLVAKDEIVSVRGVWGRPPILMVRDRYEKAIQKMGAGSD